MSSHATVYARYPTHTGVPGVKRLNKLLAEWSINSLRLKIIVLYIITLHRIASVFTHPQNNGSGKIIASFNRQTLEAPTTSSQLSRHFTRPPLSCPDLMSLFFCHTPPRFAVAFSPLRYTATTMHLDHIPRTPTTHVLGIDITNVSSQIF